MVQFRHLNLRTRASQCTASRGGCGTVCKGAIFAFLWLPPAPVFSTWVKSHLARRATLLRNFGAPGAAHVERKLGSSPGARPPSTRGVEPQAIKLPYKPTPLAAPCWVG